MFYPQIIIFNNCYILLIFKQPHFVLNYLFSKGYAGSCNICNLNTFSLSHEVDRRNMLYLKKTAKNTIDSNSLWARKIPSVWSIAVHLYFHRVTLIYPHNTNLCRVKIWRYWRMIRINNKRVTFLKNLLEERKPCAVT